MSAGVLLLGFRAVSDDDYSRVVIAQTFAASPRLDPSGTSWLPFPFWLNGAVMLVFGRGLLVAQIVAVLLGVAASLLVAIAAHRLTADRRAAVIAGALASLLAWSAWLGVATVPEGVTAALTFFAAASLASRSHRHRLEGALALLCATLSRYEPWPVAFAFAIGNVAFPAAPDHRASDRAAPDPAASDHRASDRAASPASSRLSRALRSIAVSLLAIAGPLLWIAWNRAAHGDAFHFVARVTAYRRALGDAATDSALARLVAYPAALAREMPEAVIAAVLALLVAVSASLRPAVAERLRRHAIPLILAAVQIAALSVSLVKDGAPTHHPERAVLFPALALLVFGADVASLLRGKAVRAVGLVAFIALLVRAIVIPAERRATFAQRRGEVEIGVIAARVMPPGARALIEVKDYGHFAILAASGRPESFELDRDIDPRHPTLPPRFAGEEERAAWLHARGIDYLLAPSGSERWGVTAMEEGARFGLWRVPAIDRD